MSRIALLHSPMAKASSTEAIAAALMELGHEIFPIEAMPDSDWQPRLRALAPDAVFNNAPGITTKSEQPSITAVLDLIRVPYTGSGLMAQIICQHKGLAKKCLTHSGLRTGQYAVLAAPSDADSLSALEYPIIVKPEAEGSSRGIDRECVVTDREALAARADRIRREFGCPALAETFLPGREFTVGVLGAPLRALPPVEVAFVEAGFYTHQVKEADTVRTVCPADAPAALLAEVEALAVAAAKAVGVRDYARVDIRCDARGRPTILEINAQPGLVPGYSDFPKAAAVAGIKYIELVGVLTDLTLARSRRALCDVGASN